MQLSSKTLLISMLPISNTAFAEWLDGIQNGTTSGNATGSRLVWTKGTAGGTGKGDTDGEVDSSDLSDILAMMNGSGSYLL